MKYFMFFYSQKTIFWITKFSKISIFNMPIAKMKAQNFEESRQYKTIVESSNILPRNIRFSEYQAFRRIHWFNIFLKYLTMLQLCGYKYL